MVLFFKKPKFRYSWKKNTELRAIRKLQKDSEYGIPININQKKQILVGTWNIANFDVQKRTKNCFLLIAEIIKPFDLIAIQEVKDNLLGITKIMKILGKKYSFIITDVAGNTERLCYIYKLEKIKLSNLIGEIAIPPSRKFHIKFRNKNGKKEKLYFEGFDRNPYVASWEFNDQIITTYNSHIYFGKEEKKDIKKFTRRILEIDVMAEWVNEGIKKQGDRLFSKNIILLGDMNVPTMDKKDPVYKRLLKNKMKGVDYNTHVDDGGKVGTNLSGDKTYDQLVFVDSFSSKIKRRSFGMFAWDNAVFESLWQSRRPEDFRKYAKWAISDHRIVWVLLETR